MWASMLVAKIACFVKTTCTEEDVHTITLFYLEFLSIVPSSTDMLEHDTISQRAQHDPYRSAYESLQLAEIWSSEPRDLRTLSCTLL